MAWTATLVSVDKHTPGLLLATIEFTDGVKSFQETYRQYGQPKPEWIERTVAGRIVQLEGVDATVLPTGPITDPTPPTIGELAIAEMQQDLRRLEVVERLINLGVVPIDQAQVAAFILKVRAEVVAYWDYI